MLTATLIVWLGWMLGFENVFPSLRDNTLPLRLQTPCEPLGKLTVRGEWEGFRSISILKLRRAETTDAIRYNRVWASLNSPA